MAYSIESSNDSCYPGTSVLVNKLDFSVVDSDRMMIATIHAASGVEEILRNLFDEIITP